MEANSQNSKLLRLTDSFMLGFTTIVFHLQQTSLEKNNALWI